MLKRWMPFTATSTNWRNGLTTFMKVNQDKCKVLQLNWNNSVGLLRLGTDLESRSSERGWRILEDNILNMSQQCTFAVIKACSILIYINTDIASSSRQVTIQLHSGLVRLHTAYCTRFWTRIYKTSGRWGLKHITY